MIKRKDTNRGLAKYQPRFLLFVSLMIILSGFVFAYSVTTFSDGTSIGNMTFTSAESNYFNLSVPYWAVITKAEIDLKGLTDFDLFNYIGTNNWGNSSGTWLSSDTSPCFDKSFSTSSGVGAGKGNLTWNYTIRNNTKKIQLNYSMWQSCDNSRDLMCYNRTASGYTVVKDVNTNNEKDRINISSDCLNNGLLNFKLTLDTTGGDCGMFEQALIWNGSIVENLTIRTNNEITYQDFSNLTGTTTDIDLNISSLQDCINLCNELDGDNCNCTLNFTSVTAGILEYSNIDVEYLIPLNMTFRDERRDTLISGETFSVYLETTGFSQLYQLYTSSNPFKANLTTAGTYDVEVSSTNYPLREYVIEVLEARNDFVLYLINSTSGAEKTFSVTDSGINPLEDVFVVFTRIINGTRTTIAEEYTDYAGQCKLY